MSEGYRQIIVHTDPRNALSPAAISVMFFDSPEGGWDELPAVCCRIDPDRARGLAQELLWEADFAQRLAHQGRQAPR
jgi:hypothetical protein